MAHIMNIFLVVSVALNYSRKLINHPPPDVKGATRLRKVPCPKPQGESVADMQQGPKSPGFQQAAQ